MRAETERTAGRPGRSTVQDDQQWRFRTIRRCEMLVDRRIVERVRGLIVARGKRDRLRDRDVRGIQLKRIGAFHDFKLLRGQIVVND